MTIETDLSDIRQIKAQALEEAADEVAAEYDNGPVKRSAVADYLRSRARRIRDGGSND